MKSLKTLTLALALLFAAGPGIAQGIDPADVTFWQSIQGSDNAAEYEAYLTAFPNGVFAELARLRVQQLGGAAPAATRTGPVQPPVAQAAEEPTRDVLSDAVLAVLPERPRVGDPIKVTFADMPKSSSSDMAVVVAAGSPDSVGTTSSEGILKSTYTSNDYYITNGWEVGQLAPGAYEVRWLTKLYNNEGRLEVGARKEFEVSR